MNKLIAKLPEPKIDATCIICKTEDGYAMRNEFSNGSITKWNVISPLELKHTIFMLHFGMSENDANKLMGK